MITARDVVVALLASGATVALVAQSQAPQPPAPAQAPAASILNSTAFDWNAIPAKETDIGFTRPVVRAPTATLAELEMHITTLNPGQTSHAPHQHPNEELIIIREGTVEALVLGDWKRLGPGSIIFQATNQLHTLRNVGTGPTTYHVVNWKSK